MAAANEYDHREDAEGMVAPSPLAEASRYIRHLASFDPNVDGKGKVQVIHVESEAWDGLVILDLSDGTTIRINIERYPTEDLEV